MKNFTKIIKPTLVAVSITAFLGLSLPTFAGIQSSDKTEQINGNAPNIPRIGVSGDLLVGKTLTVPKDKLHYLFGDKDDGENSNYWDVDISRSTIEWLILAPNATVTEGLAAPAVYTGESFLIPSAAIGKVIGMRITPTTKFGLPRENYQILIMNVVNYGGDGTDPKEVDPGDTGPGPIDPNNPANPKDPNHPNTENPGGNPDEKNPDVGGPGGNKEDGGDGNPGDGSGIVQDGDRYKVIIKSTDGTVILDETKGTNQERRPNKPEVDTEYTVSIVDSQDNNKDVTSDFEKSITWYFNGQMITDPDGVNAGSTTFRTQQNNDLSRARSQDERSEQGLTISITFDNDPDAAINK
ncbi:hypothetical protein [Thorsellia anophelis]|uniref:Uncharacterized protein n=1 Tax=Thorsellia anophelis DSM 18579 TaxID=1123402 RepID=A0A1H9Z7H0_9GAMM|nr:hypothetical protein [Thorsellia anophelis]SES77012.1 hypothetical protein SAMN02583745_00440 [Thorsellia anophelis DSM 18579]